LPYWAQQAFRGYYGSGRLATEIPVRQIVCETGSVVHMTVRKQNIVYGNNLVGGFTDIKANIQLRHRNYGFFTRYRIADDFQIVYLDIG